MSSESSLSRTFALVCALSFGAGVGAVYRSTTEPLNPVKSAVNVSLAGHGTIDAINAKVAAGQDVSAAEVKQLTAYNESVNNNKEGLGLALAGAIGLLYAGVTAGRRSSGPKA